MSVEQRGHISQIMINAMHTFKNSTGKYGSQACRLHNRRNFTPFIFFFFFLHFSGAWR